MSGFLRNLLEWTFSPIRKLLDWTLPPTRRFLESWLPPFLVIVIALVVTGIAACSAIVSGVSKEESAAAGPFSAHGGAGKVRSLGKFKDAFVASQGTHPSRVANLDLDLLERSIIKNNTGMSASDEIQKYNYALTVSDQITVAVWNNKQYTGKLRQEADTGACVPDQGAPGAAPSKTDETGGVNGDRIMINVYPESQNLKESPCWVLLPSGKKLGLLDGSSKHMMLAQGDATTLMDIDKTWEDKKVKGAGEIVVILDQGQCFYTINDQSGTYKPNDHKNLQNVAKEFARSLREDDGDPVAPKFIDDDTKGLEPFDRDSAFGENEKPGSLSCR